MNPDQKNRVPWKDYLTITFESLLTFYIATFCVAMYFIHRGPQWITNGIVLLLLYVFVIFVCARRIFKALPIAALMLVIPIAPFLVIVIVISLIPILQNF